MGSGGGNVNRDYDEDVVAAIADKAADAASDDAEGREMDAGVQAEAKDVSATMDALGSGLLGRWGEEHTKQRQQPRSGPALPLVPPLLVSNLRKTFRRISSAVPASTAASSDEHKRAPAPGVNGLSLGIHSGECFGLLGKNGADHGQQRQESVAGINDMNALRSRALPNFSSQIFYHLQKSPRKYLKGSQEKKNLT